ncbi:MAG: 50S ribosomal protein L20 [Dehalococcoidia bacterium]|jgi:large subunit ribosomal protein L20|nr:50S ribosomal protein L20 [Dehalococcoidia bacterium]|tara:strand:- start:204 stop:551 length:348 start_codon:yes stop_codon:yes gene_type:complete
MSRVKGGMTTKRKHKAILSQVKGHRGAARTRVRAAKESLTHALNYSTKHRHLKKRTMRSLSITRINAATRLHGLSYSKFINLLTQKNIIIDRKSLAELAIREPEGFTSLVEQVKK